MDIRITGRKVETGQAFQVHVEERLRDSVATHFKNPISAMVTLSAAPFDHFQCDIMLHVMQGVILKGSHQAPLAHPAFDGALEKIIKQLRRYMRRLKNHGQTTLNDLPLAEFPENAEYKIFNIPETETEEPAVDTPLTIAETRVDIPDATVSDAVMMLDLRNTTALMFRNSGTGKLNMVYRREDGNIGWVEPRD